jgi:hypothetical protein
VPPSVATNLVVVNLNQLIIEYVVICDKRLLHAGRMKWGPK